MPWSGYTRILRSSGEIPQRLRCKAFWCELFDRRSHRSQSWGESAGSISTALHMVANNGDNEGLFRGAFMQSGGPITTGSLEDGEYLSLLRPSKRSLIVAQASLSLISSPPTRGVPTLWDLPSSSTVCAMHQWTPFAPQSSRLATFSTIRAYRWRGSRAWMACS